MDEKANIDFTIGLLKKMDPKSLLIIQSGAQMLVARQELEDERIKNNKQEDSPKI